MGHVVRSYNTRYELHDTTSVSSPERIDLDYSSAILDLILQFLFDPNTWTVEGLVLLGFRRTDKSLHTAFDITTENRLW